METNNFENRNNNNQKRTAKEKLKRIVLLTGVCFLASLATNYFSSQEIDIIASLRIPAIFGLFLTIGMFSRKN